MTSSRVTRIAGALTSADYLDTLSTDAVGEAYTSLIDALTDMRHFAAAHGVDFNQVNRIARDHFAAESAGA